MLLDARMNFANATGVSIEYARGAEQEGLAYWVGSDSSVATGKRNVIYQNLQ